MTTIAGKTFLILEPGEAIKVNPAKYLVHFYKGFKGYDNSELLILNKAQEWRAVESVQGILSIVPFGGTVDFEIYTPQPDNGNGGTVFTPTATSVKSAFFNLNAGQSLTGAQIETQTLEIGRAHV